MTFEKRRCPEICIFNDTWYILRDVRREAREDEPEGALVVLMSAAPSPEGGPGRHTLLYTTNSELTITVQKSRRDTRA